MDGLNSYQAEKFKSKLVGYESSDGGGTSDDLDSDSSVTGITNKRQKTSRIGQGSVDISKQLFNDKDEEKDSAYIKLAPNFTMSEFSHPVFEQASILKQGEAKKRPKNRYQRPKADEQELLVFGYASKLYDLKESVESGCIELSEHTTTVCVQGASSLWVKPSIFHPEITLDRFDVRNLSEDISLTSILSTHIETPDSRLNRIRYEFLDSDEAVLFDMDDEERDEFIGRVFQSEDRKNALEAKSRQKNSYAFSYTEKDKSVPSSSPSTETLEFSFPVPEGMFVPRTLKQLLVIERTAKFILSSSDPLLEVKIQGRQGNLLEFKFLNREDPLHEFFQKVKTLIKLGLYSYCKAEVGEDSDKSKPNTNAVSEFVPAPPPEDPKSTTINTSSDLYKHLTSDQRHFIILFARTVAFKGPTFEQKFRAEQSTNPLFSFLLPWDKSYGYYIAQVETARNQQVTDNVTELGLILPSKQFEANQLVSVLSLQVNTLGEHIEPLAYVACQDFSNLEFVLPWNSLNKYYTWKKRLAAKNTKLCEYSDDEEDLIELTAKHVSLKGAEFEKKLQEKLCLDSRFSFLMPWDAQHLSYRNQVDTSSSKSIIKKVADCSMLTKFAKIFAVHGPNLEHQIRSLFSLDARFLFLFPWGAGYLQYLSLLAQELSRASWQPKNLTEIPPPDLKGFIDQLAGVDLWDRLGFLINPSDRLSFVRYGHPFHPYYLSRVDHFQKVPGLSTMDDPKFKFWLAEQKLYTAEFFDASLNESQDLSLLVPLMELCAWLQSRVASFVSLMIHRQEFPFLLPTHPLNAFYIRIICYSQEDLAQEISDPFFPSHSDRLLIDALAKLASLLGSEFQNFLLDSKSVELFKAFPFLQPKHSCYTYYRWRVAFPNDHCYKNQGDLVLGPLSAENFLKINYVAAFVSRHGSQLKKNLWPNTQYGDKFSFLDFSDDLHSYFERKSIELECLPLESPNESDLVDSSVQCDDNYIDKVAKLVSEMGAAFEKQLLLDYPEKLAFLHKRHPKNVYYSDKLRDIKCPPPTEPSDELTDLQKIRLARVRKLLYKS